MGKMRKNHENTNGFVQATHKEVLELKAAITDILARLDKLTKMIETASFQTVMQGADISEFFPVQTSEQLELFMDRSHPDWPSRRAEFYNLLFTCVPRSSRGFAKGLIAAIFTRNYISQVKWPSTG